MGFYCGLMGFYGILWWLNGILWDFIRDLMGFRDLYHQPEFWELCDNFRCSHRFWSCFFREIHRPYATGWIRGCASKLRLQGLTVHAKWLIIVVCDIYNYIYNYNYCSMWYSRSHSTHIRYTYSIIYQVYPLQPAIHWDTPALQDRFPWPVRRAMVWRSSSENWRSMMWHELFRDIYIYTYMHSLYTYHIYMICI